MPHLPGKRGAPEGHQGKTRHVPDHFDEQVDVKLAQCPECDGHNLSVCNRHEDQHYVPISPDISLITNKHI